MKAVRIAVRAGVSAAVLAMAVLGPGCGEVPSAKAYEKAVGQLKAGKTAEGASALEALLEREPEGAFAAEAWNWLGLARWQAGDLDGAAAAFGSASERDGADWRPVYNLGMLEAERGAAEKAAGLFKQTIRLHPDGTEAMLALAELLSRRGKWEAAKSVYFQVQKRDARSLAAMTGLGRALWLEGDAARAETEFMGALEVDRDYGPALYNLGVLHATEGRADEAAVYFRRYLEAQPEGERAVAAKERLGGADIPQSGFGGGGPAAPGSAMALWQKASDEGSVEGASRALEVALESGDPAGGEIARRVFAGFPKSAEAQLAAGAYWEKTGNRAGAVEAYRRASALEPENPAALRAMARAASAGGEWDTAATALKRLAQAEPGNADVWWELADVYGDKLGMAGRGVALYREFARRFPADPRAGEAGGKMKALEEALAREKAEAEAEGTP